MNETDSAKRRSLEHQWLSLLGDCCNGTLDARGADQLDRLLCTDADFRKLYSDYMFMHASLYSESAAEEAGLGLSADSRRRDASDEMERSPQPPTTKVSLARRSSRPVAGQGTRWLRLSKLRPLRQPLLTAIAVLGFAIISSWLTYTVTRSHNGPPIASVEDATGVPSDTAVARITATYNCLWQPTQAGDATADLGYGAGLRAGQQLRLREGLVEVTFQDGATVLLEGPASFVVDGADRFDLQSGRLAAVVPERARKFCLHTQAIDVRDVGTEFGLVAQESGATELHVFSGLVKADVLDAEGRTRRQLELGSTEAARINLIAATVHEFPANHDRFIRTMIPSAGPHDGLLAYEGFDYPTGPLAAQNGGFGWAGPWFNLSVDDASGPESNRVDAGSLTTLGIVPLGNRALQAAQQNRIRRSLACSVGGVFDAAGLVENQDGVRLIGRDANTIYLSFAQRVTATDDGFYGLELHRGDGNANRVLSIGNGAEGTGYGATSNVNAYDLDSYPSFGEENTTVNFFVVKISFGMDNRDTVEIFRNPVSLRDEDACSIDAVLKGNFAFDRISLGNFDGGKLHEVDEIRVGTHYLAVTGRWGGNRGRLHWQMTYQLPAAHRSDATGLYAYLGIGRDGNPHRGLSAACEYVAWFGI